MVCSARLPKEIYAPINIAEEDVSDTQYSIRSGDVRVARIQSNSLLDVRNAFLQATKKYQCLAKPKERPRVIAVQCYCRLKLHYRFIQSVLNPAKHSKRVMSAWAVCIAFQDFEEQPLGNRLVFMASIAPSLSHFPDQERGDTHFRIYRMGVYF